MADNLAIKDGLGVSKTIAAKDVSSVWVPRHILVDDSNVSVFKAEDAAHVSGDLGMPALAVRKDAAVALGDDGDYTLLLTDLLGRLWTTSVKPNGTSRILSAAASTNATSAKASAGDLFQIVGYNAIGSLRYLKLYNKASAPTVGSDTPTHTFVIPPGPFVLDFPTPFYFSTGIAYALTTAGADADTGALTAGDITGLVLSYA
jgi:hypothetical protein